MIDVKKIGLFLFSEVVVQGYFYNYEGFLFHFKNARRKIFVMLQRTLSIGLDPVTVVIKKCHRCRYLAHFGLRNSSGFSKVVIN